MTVFTTEPGYALFCSLVANGPFALSFGCWVCSALVFFRGRFCLILLCVLFVREGQTQRGAEAEAGEWRIDLKRLELPRGRMKWGLCGEYVKFMVMSGFFQFHMELSRPFWVLILNSCLL